MIEVAPHLFVGNQIDYEKRVKGKDGWCAVQACKEPYHRQALGYTGLAGPRDHPEYLFAYRGTEPNDSTPRIILNMVDAPKPEFFRDEMIDEAMLFIGKCLEAGSKVLIHCNQGGSRAPSLAMLYLRRTDPDWHDPDLSFAEAEDMFRGLYPAYAPAKGIRAYSEQRWSRASASA